MIHSHPNRSETTNSRQGRSWKNASEKLPHQLKSALEESEMQYRKKAQSLISSKPKAEELYQHLIFLRKSRDSYQAQSNKIKDDNEKEKSIQAVISSIDDAIAMLSKYIVVQLADMGIQGGAAYAYGPREGVHYDVHTPGRDHFQLALPLVYGRLVRQMGDLMCKTSREFWGLRITDDPMRITCWACLKKMLKILGTHQKKRR